MKKINFKKIAAVAVAAACMAQIPVMADEIILDETVTEETAEAPQAEEAEALPELEMLGIEIVEPAEVPEEVAEAAEEQAAQQQAEVLEAEARDFTFENDEVIVRAQASAAAGLPENAQMHVKKMKTGSKEYEAAKRAAVESCGTSEDADYTFYDVTFAVDGAEVELAEDAVAIQIEFKTVKVGEAPVQKVLKIDESGVDNVTAQTEAGSNMSSVSFTI